MAERRASPGEGLRFLRAVAAEPPPDTCVLWPYGLSGGYGSTTFRGRKVQAHIVVCELSHGPRPDRMDAAHRCGVSACVNPRHIRWATRSENELDKRLHGTGMHGERNPRAVLTAAAVAEIREQYAIGELYQWQLGIMHGVRQNTISRIVTEARWAS